MFFIHKQTFLEGRASGLVPAPEAFDVEPDLNEWYPFEEPQMLDSELFYIAFNLVSEDPFELTYTPQLKAIDFVKGKLVERISAKHASVLDSGLTLPNGVKLLTGLEDRAMISALHTTLSIDPDIETIDYKADSGWVKLTREEGLQVHAALNAFIKHCDSRMMVLVDGVMNAADSAEAFEFYNTEVNLGWEA